MGGYIAVVVSASDYEPFGLVLDGRSLRKGGYRWGFNGKEDDGDFGGGQLIQDYGFRLYNPTIGKFLSVDPLFRGYPHLTPYQFASNRPIVAIDLDGLEAKDISGNIEPTYYQDDLDEVTITANHWWNSSATIGISLASDIAGIFVPGAGLISDGISIASDFAQGKYLAGTVGVVLAIAGVIPGLNIVAGVVKVIKKGIQFYKYGRRAQNIHRIAKTSQQAQKVAKATQELQKHVDDVAATRPSIDPNNPMRHDGFSEAGGDCVASATALDKTLEGTPTSVMDAYKSGANRNSWAGRTTELYSSNYHTLADKLKQYPHGSKFLISLQASNGTKVLTREMYGYPSNGHAMNAIVLHGEVFYMDATRKLVSDPITQAMSNYLDGHRRALKYDKILALPSGRSNMFD